MKDYLTRSHPCCSHIIWHIMIQRDKETKRQWDNEDNKITRKRDNETRVKTWICHQFIPVVISAAQSSIIFLIFRTHWAAKVWHCTGEANSHNQFSKGNYSQRSQGEALRQGSFHILRKREGPKHCTMISERMLNLVEAHFCSSVLPPFQWEGWTVQRLFCWTEWYSPPSLT